MWIKKKVKCDLFLSQFCLLLLTILTGFLTNCFVSTIDLSNNSEFFFLLAIANSYLIILTLYFTIMQKDWIVRYKLGIAASFFNPMVETSFCTKYLLFWPKYTLLKMLCLTKQYIKWKGYLWSGFNFFFFYIWVGKYNLKFLNGNFLYMWKQEVLHRLWNQELYGTHTTFTYFPFLEL